MEPITGLDLDDIERLCKECREGHLDDEDFRAQVLASLGYNKEVVDELRSHEELLELWD
jgi:hypothetical protein